MVPYAGGLNKDSLPAQISIHALCAFLINAAQEEHEWNLFRYQQPTALGYQMLYVEVHFPCHHLNVLVMGHLNRLHESSSFPLCLLGFYL